MKADRTTVVLTCEKCRRADRYAIDQLGIPGIVLMENAGRNAADHIERLALQRGRKQGDSRPGAISIVCGKGNNGGDGFVVARQLVNRGWPVSVDLAAGAGALSGDAGINHATAARMRIPIRPLNGSAALADAAARWRGATVVVDALLGTGFTGEVREPLAGIINAINHARCGEGRNPIVVAIDAPSGLNADTGAAAGPAIRADWTVTFLAAKPAYRKKTARQFVGRLKVVDIGVSLELVLKAMSCEP